MNDAPLSCNGMKRCRTCSEQKPVEQFRKVRRNSPERRNECRDCHNFARKIRRLDASDLRDDKKLAKLFSQVRRASSLNKMASLVATVIDQLGGIEAVAVRWEAMIDRATQSRRGLGSALRSFAALAKMVAALSPASDNAARAIDLTDWTYDPADFC